jgi:hypothetical protein
MIEIEIELTEELLDLLNERFAQVNDPNDSLEVTQITVHRQPHVVIVVS